MKEEKLSLDIEGMTCSHCATGIEKLFDKNKGVVSKKVNHVSGKDEFTINPEVTSKEEIVKTINKTKTYEVK